MWFEGRAQIERQQIILSNVRELIGQLTARRGWPDSKGRLQVESKQDMRARGLPSPDRAEAVLGAMSKPAPTGAWDAATIAEVRAANPHLFTQPRSFYRMPPYPFTPSSWLR